MMRFKQRIKGHKTMIFLDYLHCAMAAFYAVEAALTINIFRHRLS
jgi:hypothetical protein